ncbi:MAG TPA: UTRA domain-containing protein [Ktedonobacteraceae bacterium]|jgi:DNA-binding GntR family transcriptional regulator
MREPTLEELIRTEPPDLRQSKGTQAHFDLRARILTGTYPAHHLLTSKEIEETYKVSNTAATIALLRLAFEGLVNVFPVREKIWPNNAAINEYRVADIRRRPPPHPHFDSQEENRWDARALVPRETMTLEVADADEEIAALLAVEPGESVVHHRHLQRRDRSFIVCITDHYLPFWFTGMLSLLERPEQSMARLLRQMGKNPAWCTETVEVTHANSVQRRAFDLSADDPSSLLKITRRSFDARGRPLDVQFLTDRGSRLHYVFPLTEDERFPEF